MFFTHGTRSRYFRTSSTRISLYLTLFASLALFVGATGHANEETPLTLAETERLALANEPGQDVFLARAEALDEQSMAVGQLPDPQLRLGVVNFPLESGDFRTEGMTQAVIGIRQSIPRGQTRSASTSRLQSLSADQRARAEARAREVLMTARQSWLDVDYWENAEKIILDIRPYFSDLVVVTRSLYSVGVRDQQDVLRAELELSRIDDRLIDIGKQIEHSRAVLAEWVGPDNSQRPLDGSVPEVSVPALEVLFEKLKSHPTLIAADARIDASGDGVILAEQGFKPAWGVEVNYGYRDGQLANGKSRSDFISAMVTFDLPIFTSKRQDKHLQAAKREKRAMTSSKTELYRSLRRITEAEYRNWEKLTKRVEFYDELLVPQARGNAQAALAAYQSDASDFADVMRGRITELDVRLDQLRLKSNRQKSYAVLASLGGLQK